MLEHAQSDKLHVNLTRSESTANTRAADDSATSSADSTLEAEDADPELCGKLVVMVTDQVSWRLPTCVRVYERRVYERRVYERRVYERCVYERLCTSACVWLLVTVINREGLHWCR